MITWPDPSSTYWKSFLVCLLIVCDLLVVLGLFLLAQAAFAPVCPACPQLQTNLAATIPPTELRLSSEKLILPEIPPVQEFHTCNPCQFCSFANIEQLQKQKLKKEPSAFLFSCIGFRQIAIINSQYRNDTIFYSIRLDLPNNGCYMLALTVGYENERPFLLSNI